MDKLSSIVRGAVDCNNLILLEYALKRKFTQLREHCQAPVHLVGAEHYHIWLLSDVIYFRS